MRPVAIAMLFALGAGLGPTAIALMPRSANAVAVVTVPWAADGAAAQLVAAADGVLVATAHGGRIAVARFDSDGFVAKLYRLGALFVVDATVVSTCFTLTRESR